MNDACFTTAILFIGTGKPWGQERVPIPYLQPGQLLVEVAACTICGSDVHSVMGRRQVPTPSVLGHEIVGTIVAIGPEPYNATIDDQPLAIGDRVCWCLIANCGECYYCQHDLPQKCDRGIKYGHHAWQGPTDLTGGFAEHCLLVRDTKIVKIPIDLPLEIACPASCATATIAASMEASQIQAGDTVAVLGAGMLGLTACAMAKQQGARTVLCVEQSPARQRLSYRFGADWSGAAPDFATVVHESTSGRGLDCMIECTGANQAFDFALPLLRLGGRMILVGSVFPASPVAISLESIVRRNLSIIGIHNYAPRHLMQAVYFLDTARHKFPFHELVSDWYPLNEIDRAFEHARSGNAIRVGLCSTRST